jgi:dCMP deaminase
MSVNDNVPERHERPLKYLYFAHSEANAIFSCARFGISSLGSTLYTQGIPCSSCSQAIIQAGVSEIVVHVQWPNLTHSEKWVESIQVSITMLDEANIRIRWLDKELGLKGMLDGKEINV